MLKQLKVRSIVTWLEKLTKLKYFYLTVAFLLPFLFYFGVFFGRSFGLECATGVMGFEPPYQQDFTRAGNSYCSSIADIGAYAWQHYPHWTKAATEYLELNFPLWNQNNGIGVPLAANFISSVYFFPNIFFAIFNSVLAFDIYFILRMSVASLGMYLFLRTLKLPPLLSLIGPLIVFLNGYVTSIPTIVHLNVDILLPWIGFLVNKSLETKQLKYFALLGLATGLSHLGGMPESSIFIGFFFVLYITYLSFIVNGSKRLFLFAAFMLSLGISFLLAAILVLPGLEYILNGASFHHPGQPQPYYVGWQNVVFWGFPKILGSVIGSRIYQTYLSFGIFNLNYLGAFASFFLVTTFFLVTFKFKRLVLEQNFKYFIFFTLLLILLLLQYFGVFQNPIFTKLPAFAQTDFPKYSQTLINFLSGVVVVFTIFYLSKIKTFWIPLLAILVFAAVEVFIYLKLRTAALSLSVEKYEILILQLGLTAVVVSLTILLVALLNFAKKTHLIFLGLLLLCAVEFFLYLPFKGDLQRRDSYRKPPFIDHLKGMDYKESRTFSPDYILYPNTNSVFNINDVRNLDALWPKNYYEYLGEFVIPDIDRAAMRFTGLRNHFTQIDANFVNNPFFDLLGVKYILSYSDVNAYADSFKLDPYLAQLPEGTTLRKEVFIIGGISRPVLFEHAPQKVSVQVTRPQNENYFYLYPAISEKVFNTSVGNGVKFIATASQEGVVISSHTLTINPKDNPSDRKWFEIKLGPFTPNARTFTLTLETDARGDTQDDWSGWGGFEWEGQRNQPKSYQFEKIYDKEIKIFENKNFVPRLHPIAKLVCAQNEKDIIKKMRSLEPTIKTVAVVLAKTCSEKTFAESKISINDQVFGDSKITFNYSSPGDQYVILSNTFYPGWKLKVNGKEIPIERTNYTFQGLRLPAGKNVRVEVIYDADSFKLGFGLTSISLLLSVFVLWKFGNRKIDTIKTARVK